MNQIEPVLRLIGVFLLIAAAFINVTILQISVIYFVLLGLLSISNVVKEHAKFVLFFGLPIGCALWIIWGWANTTTSTAGLSGTQYAFRSWVRILICAGSVQFLFLPILAKPVLFKRFVQKLRLPQSISILTLSSVFFLPEIRRRISMIFDARKAQGFKTSGIAGLRSLPVVLMPLVSSLLLSSIQRGQLWSHRNVLDIDAALDETTYSKPLSYTFVFVALLMVAMGITGFFV